LIRCVGVAGGLEGMGHNSSKVWMLKVRLFIFDLMYVGGGSLLKVLMRDRDLFTFNTSTLQNIDASGDRFCFINGNEV
jgi:hypothetical protein